SVAFDDAGVAVVVGDGAGEVPGDVEGDRLAGVPGGAQGDVQPVGLAVQPVEHPQFTRRLVDQASPVGGEVPCVVPVMVGVALQIPAVGINGVDVPVALVVGQEGNAPADPHGVAHVALEFGGQPFEVSAAVVVDPEFACRAAPVALPPRLFPAQGTAHDHGPFITNRGAPREGIDRTVIQPAGRRAVQRHGVGPGQPGVTLPAGGYCNDVPL